MKIRKGFVSNSSSSSFILNYPKDELMPFIVDHINIAKQLKYDCDDYYSPSQSDSWTIYENKNNLHFETTMNNFYLEGFINYIKNFEIDNKTIRNFEKSATLIHGVQYVRKNIIKEYHNINQNNKIKNDDIIGYSYYLDENYQIFVYYSINYSSNYKIKNYLNKIKPIIRKNKFNKLNGENKFQK
jgi:uncharacterized protein YkuJ